MPANSSASNRPGRFDIEEQVTTRMPSPNSSPFTAPRMVNACDRTQGVARIPGRFLSHRYAPHVAIPTIEAWEAVRFQRAHRVPLDAVNPRFGHKRANSQFGVPCPTALRGHANRLTLLS